MPAGLLIGTVSAPKDETRREGWRVGWRDGWDGCVCPALYKTEGWIEKRGLFSRPLAC